MRSRFGLVVVALLAACLCSPAQLAGAGAAPARPLSGLVELSLTGPARTVTPTLLGLNGVNTAGPPWNDSPLDAVLGQFAPGVIRYPGGTVANYWAWPTGWFQPGSWPGEPPKPVDDRLAAFAAAVQGAGAIPLFDLNTVTYQGAIATAGNNIALLHQQLRFLHAAAAQGLPVQMTELGNELYQDGPTNKHHGPHEQDYADRFPAAADYARQMNRWIAALHSAFPGVQVAAVATDANDVPYLSPRRRSWNAGVLSLLKGEDAVTVHENMRIADAAAAPATVLALPYLHFQKLTANELALFASYRLPVWVTEFNLDDRTAGHVFEGTWLHGLFVAEQALLFLSDPAITYVGLNATIGTASAAPIFSGSDGFGRGGPPTVPLALSAAGTTLAVIQAAFHQASTAQPLSFSPNPELASTGAPALLGEALTTPSGPKLLIVNLSSQPVTLDVSAFFPSGYTATQVTAPAISTQVTGPSSVQTSTATATGPLSLQPYTLTEISG